MNCKTVLTNIACLCWCILSFNCKTEQKEKKEEAKKDSTISMQNSDSMPFDSAFINLDSALERVNALFHGKDLESIQRNLVDAKKYLVIAREEANEGSQFDYTSHSERISWKNATDLTEEYKNYRPLRVRVEDPNRTGNYVDSALRGLRFNAKQLDEIINHNKHLNPGDTADEVIIMLGKEGTSGNWPNRYAHMHIVAVGIKNDSLLFNSDVTDAVKSSVFDKADPCPPNCPKSK